MNAFAVQYLIVHCLSVALVLACYTNSAKQRRGRAGRVRPGVCFHMCSRYNYAHNDAIVLGAA
eukprot:7971-Heterococcus_DN1.PRE.4